MNIYLTDHVLEQDSYPKLWETARRYGAEGVIVSLSQDGALAEGKISSILSCVTHTQVPLVGVRLPVEAESLSSLKNIISRALESAVRVHSPALVLQLKGLFLQAEEAVRQAMDSFSSSIFSEARGKGIDLVLEGPLTADWFKRIHTGEGGQQYGVSFNLAEALWYGVDPVQELSHLRPWLKQIVCNDLQGQPGDCRVGKGFVDYRLIKDFLSENPLPSLEGCVLDGPAGFPETVGRDTSALRYFFPALRKQIRWPVFGAMSYEFPYAEGQLDSLIANLKQKKIEYIQVGGALLEELVAHPDRASETVQKLAGEGIFFVGVAAYKNIVSVHEEKRAKNIDLMKRYLQLAPLLGVSPVATETGTLNPDHDFRHSPHNYSKEAWDTLYKALDVLVPVAEEHHSCIALEGYVNNIVGTLPQVRKILQEYPTGAIQLVSDPCNFLHSRLLPSQGWVTRRFIEEFEDRLILAHIKDVNPAGAEKGTPEYGEGVFELSAYLRFLYERRPDMPLILEHLPSEHVPIVMDRVMKKIQEGGFL